MRAGPLRSFDVDRGTHEPLDEEPAPRRPYEGELKRKLPNDTQTIKTNNSPRSPYIRNFQQLSKVHKVNVRQSIIQNLDLACTFKTLTVVDFSENEETTRPQTVETAFGQPSGEPSPTTSEEEVPDLVPDGECPPIPNAIEDDCQSIEEDDWAPPGAVLDDHLFRRPYSQVSPPVYRRRRVIYDQRLLRGTLWEQ